MRSAETALLSLDSVFLHFGGLEVLNDVSLTVEQGHALGIVGPNGAGKTSLLNCVNGVYRPSSGHINVAGTRVNDLPPHRIARLGVARTFQSPQIVADLTVRSTVLLGRHLRMRSGLLSAAIGRGSWGREAKDQARTAYEVLAAVGISESADMPAQSLPYGRQKLVELARALAAEPSLLLLDEPTAGLSAEERRAAAALLVDIRRQRPALSLMLIEHDIPFVRSVCDSLVVLDFGRVIANGDPDAVMSDPRVVSAYLGTGSTNPDRPLGVRSPRI